MYKICLVEDENSLNDLITVYLKKEGYEFKTEWESKKNRYGETINFKRYYLEDIVSENMEHIPILSQEANDEG